MKEKKGQKKIGIVTLFGYTNYGNRLQNYASTKLFEEMGFKVDTLVNKKSFLFEAFRTVKRCVNLLKDGKKSIKRYKNFKRFTKKYISVRTLYSRDGLISKSLSSQYDFFAVGSDQVWNPHIRKKERENFFLRFAERSQRIALSPSLGVDGIENEYKYLFKKYLSGFNFLSARENSGAAILEELTGKTVETVPDPVFSVTKEQWRSLYGKKTVNEKYLLAFFLGKLNDEKRTELNTVAKEKNLSLIVLSDKSSPYYSDGPERFIELIDGAELVYTDSFHCVAFSTILNTPFIACKRDSNDISAKGSSRITDLLDLLSLQSRWEMSLDDESAFVCDFEESNSIIEKIRKQIKEYVKKCIENNFANSIASIEDNCVGCNSCAQTCPNDSITMEYNVEGFSYPNLNVNSCINCGLCKRACPITKSNEKKEDKDLFAVYAKDYELLTQSTSGAIFSVLAEKMINEGADVYGAAFDDDFKVIHISAEDTQQLKRIKKAKYVQSDVKNTYKEIKVKLEEQKNILFSGTPCQVAGLKAYLGKDYGNLYTVDFICHGVMAPGIWLDYVKELVKAHEDSPVKEVDFRKKEYGGWENSSFYVRFDSGKEYISQSKDDPYMMAFKSNLALRSACYDCKFKGLDRKSDITVGDFWHIGSYAPEMDNKSGTSFLLVTSEKGKELFESVLDDIEYKSIPLRPYIDVANRSLMESSRPNPNRSAFYGELCALMPSEALNRYSEQSAAKRSFFQRLKRKLIKLLHRKK